MSCAVPRLAFIEDVSFPWIKQRLFSCLSGVLFLTILLMWGISVRRAQIVQFNTPKAMFQLGFQHSFIHMSIREDSHPKNWEFFTHGGLSGTPRTLFPAHPPRVQNHRHQKGLSTPFWQVAGLVGLLGIVVFCIEAKRRARLT